MIRFNCDYNEGAHPRIMQRLIETNFEQTPGYGEDEYCEKAAELLLEICEAPGSEAHFLVGGTQTNLTFLSAALRPYQGVISAVTGHIFVHETGSIEACGHKVLSVPTTDGKITAAQIRDMCKAHIEDEAHEHMVMPKAVYISNPTELGTIYSKAELSEIRAVCDEYSLIMYLDGARLGYGLASYANDLDLAFIARTCDAFYIGGTKQGALFGEALIIRNEALQRDFRYLIKQKGGMLAKGRLLGIQFHELFKDGLYMQLSEHADRLADEIRLALADMGYKFLVDSPTNQQFPILPDALIQELESKYSYAYQVRIDDSNSAIRFCTSWATKPEDVRTLISDLRELNLRKDLT